MNQNYLCRLDRAILDSRYYSPSSRDNRDVGPEHALMPLLSVGVGSKAPINGKREVRGFKSQAIDRDKDWFGWALFFIKSVAGTFSKRWFERL